ncbi:hypothetical protein KRR55_10765 [Paeniglutamicibacter sp. ABSL32-1]|uniref:hypothetical protein n=1 Tax=Paeniglutamicibacter quisquiliarum TaxID=2849498 RepID=UPI001C2CF77B|nr:hypothetical protein [Paeniglutamicibacter quisquiliarum]MBV1779592.1 hypothetical protein [Paeniglutamicibacter quisquiliarum]
MKTFKNGAMLLSATAGVLLALTGCSAAAEQPSGASSAGAEAAPVQAEIVVPEAKEIFPKTSAAIEKATSATIVGDLTVDSQKGKFELSGTVDGTNSKSMMSRGDSTIEMLTVDNVAYMKPNKEFLTEQAGAEAAKMLDSVAPGKWISTKNASLFGNLKIGSLLESMGTGELGTKEAAKITKKDLADLNGTKAFKYTGGEEVFWIAAEGEPHLLKIESTGTGTMTFTEWNAVKPYEAPAKSDVVSVPGL